MIAQTDWQAYYIPLLRTEIERATQQLESAMRNSMDKGLTKAWNDGLDLINKPFMVANIPTNLFNIGTEALTVTKELAADLVKDISRTSSGEIMKQIQYGILAKKPQLDVMKALGTIIVNDAKRKLQPQLTFKTLTHRTMAIARTETGRVLAAGHYAQMERMAEEYDELRKFWMATFDKRGRPHHQHADLKTNPSHKGVPIKSNEMFSLGKYQGRMPHDPSLPASESVQCRCRLGTTLFNDAELEKYYGKAKPVILKDKLDRIYADDRLKQLSRIEAEASGKKIINAFKKENAEETKINIIDNLANKTGIEKEKINRTIKKWAETSNDNNLFALKMQQAMSEEFNIPMSRWQKVQFVKAQKQVDNNIKTIMNELQIESKEQVSTMIKKAAANYISGQTEDVIDTFVNYAEKRGLSLKYNAMQAIDSLYINTPVMNNVETRKFLRAMYDLTQEKLKSMNIDEVILFRGVKISDNKFNKVVNLAINKYKGNAAESWSADYNIANEFGNLVSMAKIPANRIIGSCISGYGCLDEFEFIILGGTNDNVMIKIRKSI